MGLILRTSSLANVGDTITIKNSPLEYTEGDGNFMYLLTNMSGSNISIIGQTSITGSSIISGSLTVTSTITAQQLLVQTITSSVSYITGSTRFGSSSLDTHQFTGSVSITGSLAVNGSNVILTNQTSSMSVLSASYAINATSASFATQATNATTASFVRNAVSASYVLNAVSASYALQSQNAVSSSYPIAVNGSSIYAFNSNNAGGNNNIILGNEAFSGSTAVYTVAIGPQAGYLSTGADQNIFIGNEAGKEMIDSDTVTAIGGWRAGYQANNVDSSIFIGRRSGWGLTNSQYTVFLGENSGYLSQVSSYSIGIGESAGSEIVNSEYGIFIGASSGIASQGTNSIFIGKTAGANASGSNNIIIGNNLTLEAGRENSINIGGFLFGTGSFIGTSYDTFSGSLTTGRLGINNSLPQFNLDVSGSGRYTNGLTVTGSTNISQVLNLAAQNPLPTGQLGNLAVSSSALYFHDGLTWKEVSLVP